MVASYQSRMRSRAGKVLGLRDNQPETPRFVRQKEQLIKTTDVFPLFRSTLLRRKKIINIKLG